MRSWSRLTKDEQQEIYDRWIAGENVDELSRDYDTYSVSMKRRLQEMRNNLSGVNSGGSKDKVKVESSDANNITISASGRVTTLDDLLKACNVDLNVWEVDHWIANTWEGWRKDDQKDITWVDGTIVTGFTKDSGGISTTTLYQVKAWLVRREPIEVEPAVRPVVMQPLKVAYQQHRPGELSNTLIIPDVHFGFKKQRGQLIPFHDRQAVSLLFQLTDMMQFDNIVVLGDYLDMAEWSDKFITSPEFEQLTQPALEEAAWVLGQLRLRQPGARMFYIEGNHEKRLRDAIIKHIPQAYHLKPVNVKVDFSAWSLERLLNLDSMGIEWIGDYPNGTVWLEDDLCCVHGSALSAQKVVDGADVSTIFGHIHRFDTASRAIYSRHGIKTIMAYSPGFLGRMDGQVPGVKDNQRWSQGFSIIQHARGVEARINHVPISNGKAILVDGIYEGYDYSKELVAQVPELSYYSV